MVRPKIPNTHRWIISIAAVVLILLAAQAFRLGKDVQTRIEALSSAATDNLQWTLSQAEVDYLKYRFAAMQVRQRQDLPRLRRQFDIYYSRIATFRESSSYSGVRATPEGGETLERLHQGLLEQAELIDSSDDTLLARSDELLRMIVSEGDDVRDLALFGVVLQAETAGEERVLLHELFSRLAIVVLALMGTLALTALVILRLFRRGQRLSMLQAQEAARTEAMVTSSLDAILMADAAGRITAINGAAEEIFGYSEEEAIGLSFDALVLNSPDNSGPNKIDDILRESDGRIEMTAQRKNGEILPVEVSLTLSKSNGNQVLVSYVRDISRRLQAEEELRRARDDALAGEQAKDRLLTVMSHEMRTPLTGILGSLDVLEDLGPTADQQRYMQAMRVSGELLLHHVNDVLQLSRLEAGADPDPPHPFDLDELVSGIGESQQAIARRNNNELTVFCSLGGSSGVEGRCRYVQQVLLNLIGNALKFTHDGAVSVDVMRTEGDLVEFSVADTGKGIAAEDLDRIFDDFTMLDPSYKRGSEGTGLGLAISRRLVRLMGGEITCESEPDEGSLFTFTIPLPPVALDETAQDAQPIGMPTGRRLLVIEDNDINRLLLEKMLGDLGHDVISADGGAAGIEMIRAERFDLVISDISMPDVDGMEVLRRVRTEGLADGIDIVALTAHAARDDHERILDAGFAEVLTKPIDRAALAEMVSRRCAGSNPPPQQNTPQQDESDITQFVEAVGTEKARHFLAEFRSDVQALRDALSESGELTESHRQEAHRLAGSAAVLGFGALRASMLQIEQANTNAVPELAHLQDAWGSAEEVLARHVGS